MKIGIVITSFSECAGSSCRLVKMDQGANAPVLISRPFQHGCHFMREWRRFNTMSAV
jgi:hypothetical protein